MPWDVTPGVPAYAAAAAILGRELTGARAGPDRDLDPHVRRVHADAPERVAGLLAQSRATLVLHLAIRHVRRLAAELACTYGPDCPVAVVANASQPNEACSAGR